MGTQESIGPPFADRSASRTKLILPKYIGQTVEVIKIRDILYSLSCSLARIHQPAHQVLNPNRSLPSGIVESSWRQAWLR